MAIKWTPWWNVPLHRRLEVLWASFAIFIALICGPLCTVLICYLLWAGNMYLKMICLMYLTFIYYDRNAGDTGGRGAGSKWCREWSIWVHYLNYFSVDLVKTAELPADRNYLICLFPHGVICQSAFANFGTNCSKFPKLFPGIRSKVATLGYHMYLPVSRELILNWGMCSASSNSLTTVLSQSNEPDHPSNRDGYTSNAAVLMVGGAEEAFSALPNRYRFVLKNRKGFIKIALKCGAPLVPAISFGENNIFDIAYYPSGTWLRKIQDWLKKVTGVAPVHFNGRGFLQYNFGLIPKRHPLVTVMGAPIDVKKTPKPTNEETDALHALFCERLIDLFETHKSKYIENCKDLHVEIV